jgi:hypothetical protein
MRCRWSDRPEWGVPVKSGLPFSHLSASKYKAVENIEVNMNRMALALLAFIFALALILIEIMTYVFCPLYEVQAGIGLIVTFMAYLICADYIETSKSKDKP